MNCKFALAIFISLLGSLPVLGGERLETMASFNIDLNTCQSRSECRKSVKGQAKSFCGNYMAKNTREDRTSIQVSTDYRISNGDYQTRTVVRNFLTYCDFSCNTFWDIYSCDVIKYRRIISVDRGKFKRTYSSSLD